MIRKKQVIFLLQYNIHTTYLINLLINVPFGHSSNVFWSLDATNKR